ncbi:agmatine deiminase family protein, partial [Flavobacteriales bacterium]|nr:agmatine deiminase family protein [Flavobacteriales bacterium]
CYVNYLEVQDLIVLPIFGTASNKDKEVYDTFRQIFPDRKVETIDFNEIGVLGGLLNCSTWTIEKPHFNRNNQQ